MVTRVFDQTTYGVWRGHSSTYKWMGYPSSESGGYSGFGLTTARVTYLDPASPLGVLPRIAASTAYTVGQKCTITMANGGVYGLNVIVAYLECITAGTTPSTVPMMSSSYLYNGCRFPSGTATFVVRLFHSWDRAYAGVTGAPEHQYFWSLYRIGCDAYTVPAWTTAITFLVASTAVNDLSVTGKTAIGASPNTLNTQYYPDRINHLEGAMISVSKAAWPATTYAAGATYNGYSTYNATPAVDPGHWSYTAVTAYLFNEVMAYRGLSAIHVPQNELGVANDEDYGSFVSYYASAVTAYDCTIASTARDNTVFGEKARPIIGGYRHLTRCTISSTANAGIPAPLAGGWVANAGGGGIPGLPPGPSGEGIASSFDACTFTRTLSTHATSPIFAECNFYDSASYNNPWGTQDNAYIFGGDCSGISSPLAGVTELGDPTTVTNLGLVTLYGVKANANSYPSTLDELEPKYWQVIDGTTPVSMWPDFTRSTTVYRTGGAHDGTSNYSLMAALTISKSSVTYLYSFQNKKTDGPYTITHELQLQNTTGSGLTGLNVDDAVLTVVYPCDPVTEETEWACSAPEESLGCVPQVASSNAPTSTATWTGTVTNGVKQKVSVTIFPRKIGPVIVYLRFELCPRTLNLWNQATVPTLNIYFDPLPVLTAA